MNDASTVDMVNEYVRLVTIKQYAIGTFVLIVYEYLITFDAEVDLIWKRKFTFVTVLWFFNRYIMLFTQGPAVLFHFYALTDEKLMAYLRCGMFVKFPGIMQIISNTSTGLTLILRTYALYNRSTTIAILLLMALAGEIAVELWAVADGIAIEIPEALGACILSGEPQEWVPRSLRPFLTFYEPSGCLPRHSGIRFTAFWIGQLVFPSIITILTVARALKFRGVRADTVQVMLRDGVLYFAVVFLINLVNVIIYVTAPIGLNAINAPMSAVLSSMMMCRLMLNLSQSPSTSRTGTRTHVTTTWMLTTEELTAEFFIGNLGEHVKSSPDAGSDLKDADGMYGHPSTSHSQAHGESLGDEVELPLVPCMSTGDEMDHVSALHVVDELARQVMIKQYSAATFALIFYEYIITFEAEVNLIWRRRFTFVSGLWFFNRYIVLFTQAPSFIWFTAFWIGQLVFPTVIVALTVARALKFRGARVGTLVQVILRDGVLYFLVVFLINLVNVVVYVTAPVGINAINAPLSAALTSMMICRLMLNLSESHAASYMRTRTQMPTMEDLTAEFFIGDLSEDLKSGAERDVDGFGEEVELNTRGAHDQPLPISI
ncbi:hypothetical protein HETIRDRAFT_103588 [Heterobasidion irregulare TC 32-1]|uniref:DUF6533 domain-containing protein n=1 Tax=Heterobasidion irregulare (strain TC 32-1) TaxID=747525 RepID=W4K3B4_HETIT|nr:uncharacterized protein HETIRDRAFT_103588 [Heterobasidion irregulare TC 32-1]ETW79820.1 hypothetical protein HETIRDRAFT_103588 [Heterobasidion irregulare TC 32-1]